MSKISPPTLMFFCLLGMVAMHWMFPLVRGSAWILLILGLGCIILGMSIAIGAESQFRRSQTTVNHLGKATKLVTDGWFKYSRNPMYLSLALMLVGAWLSLGSLSPVLGLPVYLILAERWYILPEERRLAMAFGKEYESYQRRTPRWL